jgi:hypothetical protein
MNRGSQNCSVFPFRANTGLLPEQIQVSPLEIWPLTITSAQSSPAEAEISQTKSK